MQPRVPLLDVEEAKKRGVELGLPEQLAELNVFRMLLQHPPLAQRIADLLMTQLFQGKLDRKLRELVIMRIGWRTACDYEWTQHWRIAQQFGVPTDTLLALREEDPHPHLDAAGRAIVAATDETLDHGAITPETWAALEKALPTAEERLEVASAISTWHLISEMARSLQIPLEEGVASWPPEGEAPARG